MKNPTVNHSHTPLSNQELPVAAVVGMAARALGKWAVNPTDPALAAALLALEPALASAANALAATHKARVASGASQSGGRPKHPYLIEHELHGTWIAWGGQAAAAALGITPAAFSVGLTKGKWVSRTDSTPNGDFVVSARRCTPDETVTALSALGTENAISKTHAKVPEKP